MASVKPFNINVSEEKLATLKSKLENATFPNEIEDVDWAMGAPLADVQRLTKYWKDGFDWRKQEQKLNDLPQYTVTVDVPGFGNLEIHTIHQKSSVEGAVPLLFVHGCKDDLS